MKVDRKMEALGQLSIHMNFVSILPTPIRKGTLVNTVLPNAAIKAKRQFIVVGL